MSSLPNGCKCSELKVHPRNWASSKASVKRPWYIHYRFYDPSIASEGKLRIIKGMNEFSKLHNRQNATRALIELELNELKNLGFNPIKETHISPLSLESAISPECSFIHALNKAYQKGMYVGRTLTDIKSVLKYIGQAAILLHIDNLPIREVRPSHLLLLLEQCSRSKAVWTNNTHNVYIKYLSILFSQILQYRAIDFNPARDLKKKKVVLKIRGSGGVLIQQPVDGI
jgi:hypothetical protein